MEADSSTTQDIGLKWDLSEALDDISSTVRDSENGVRVVAEDGGVKLWAEILNGKAIDYRAFREDGSEIGIVIFIEPDARLAQPTKTELRPLRPDEGPAGNPPPPGVPGDGGVLAMSARCPAGKTKVCYQTNYGVLKCVCT
jgi:hypothetical protein